MQRPSSWRGWQTRPWSALLFGSATFATWTAAHYVVTSISSPPASPAQTSASPVSEPGSREIDPACGERLCDSPTKPERPTSSSRTSLPFARLEAGTWTIPQGTLFAPSALYLETWPRSGSMRSGCAYERPTWAPRTGGIGGSAWPTATSRDSKDGACADANVETNALLGRAVTRWPTPRTITGGAESAERKQELGREESGGGDLQAAATLWPTPQVGTGENSHGQISGDFRNRMEDLLSKWQTPRAGVHDSPGPHTSRGEVDALEPQAQLWQTPATDSFRSRGGDRREEMGLDQQSRFWPTPAASVINDGEGPETFDARRERLRELGINGNGAGLMLPVEAVRFHRVRVISTAGVELSPTDLSTSQRRRLNPAFVCWLMGFPWWWTRAEPISFAAAEMQSWLCRQRRLLWSYFGE